MTEFTAPQTEPEPPLVGWQPRERPRRLRDRWALWFVLLAGLAILFVVIPASLVLVHGEENRAEWEGVADEFMCAMRDGKVALALTMLDDRLLLRLGAMGQDGCVRRCPVRVHTDLDNPPSDCFP